MGNGSLQVVWNPNGPAGPGTGGRCPDTAGTGTSTGYWNCPIRLYARRLLWTGQGRDPLGMRQGIWWRKAQTLLLVIPFCRYHDSRNERGFHEGHGMTDTIENTPEISFGLPPSPRCGHYEKPGQQVTSIPLRTALRIAKERQRSKSSRRKIFREEPERYLDIVHLMKETGNE